MLLTLLLALFYLMPIMSISREDICNSLAFSSGFLRVFSSFIAKQNSFLLFCSSPH